MFVNSQGVVYSHPSDREYQEEVASLCMKYLDLQPRHLLVDLAGVFLIGLAQNLFLASPDALEVIVVTYWVIVSTDLTDVTLVSDGT